MKTEASSPEEYINQLPVIPHSLYPPGYHVNPSLPLPFISLALQKNHIALYHMGIYADKNLMNWFISEYNKRTNKKPDIGKSCIRFKKGEDIPVDLISALAGIITPGDWIEMYESVRNQ